MENFEARATRLGYFAAAARKNAAQLLMRLRLPGLGGSTDAVASHVSFAQLTYCVHCVRWIELRFKMTARIAAQYFLLQNASRNLVA